jgi:hypothetical protein
LERVRGEILLHLCELLDFSEFGAKRTFILFHLVWLCRWKKLLIACGFVGSLSSDFLLFLSVFAVDRVERLIGQTFGPCFKNF